MFFVFAFPVGLLTLYLWAAYLLEKLTVWNTTVSSQFVICVWVYYRFALRVLTFMWLNSLGLLRLLAFGYGWKGPFPLVLKKNFPMVFSVLLLHSTFYIYLNIWSVWKISWHKLWGTDPNILFQKAAPLSQSYLLNSPCLPFWLEFSPDTYTIFP